MLDYKKSGREPIAWITRGGKHIPIFDKKYEKSKTESIIAYIEGKTGLKFNKAQGSDSYYAEGQRVRLSDHASKFIEKSKELWDTKDALDLNYEYYSPDAIVHLVNKTDPFANYKLGDKIVHSASQVGDVTYLGSDYVKGYVEVKTRDGRVVKYNMEKFLWIGNKLAKHNHKR